MNNHPKPPPLIRVCLGSDLKQLPRSSEGWSFKRGHPCYIYSICDPINNRHYIGATGCLRTRIQGHKSQLRRGTHSSKKLQEHFNKFGENSLYVYLLEIVTPYQKGKSRERYFHYLYDSILDGFNRDPISGFGGSFWS